MSAGMDGLLQIAQAEARRQNGEARQPGVNILAWRHDGSRWMNAANMSRALAVLRAASASWSAVFVNQPGMRLAAILIGEGFREFHALVEVDGSLVSLRNEPEWELAQWLLDRFYFPDGPRNSISANSQMSRPIPATDFQQTKKGLAAIHDSAPSPQMRFRLARKELGLTQAALAATLGVKEQAVSDVERGLNNLSMAMLTKMVTMHRISAYWLLEGEPPIKRI